MRAVWLAIWKLLGLFIASAEPIALGANDLANTFACGARIARKSTENFETSLDIDAVSAALALRKAKAAAEAEA